MTARLCVALLLGATTTVAAQGRRCLLQIDSVSRQGVSVSVTGTATTNYFAGGDVQMSCRGQNVRIWTDSVASYQGQIVQFIGNFRYEDETAKFTSDFGTYYKDTERWEARGNVNYLDIKDRSTMRGPSLDYYRQVRGTREEEEIFADQRPTFTLATRDSVNRRPDPYVIVGDRIRMRGDDQMWAGGTVTIDRSDLRGRSDSMQLDTGKGSAGALIGRASIRRAAEDSFNLVGRRIDLALTNRELTGVTGRDSATSLTSRNLDLFASVIDLKLVDRKVVQTLAWGKSPRPKALADDYEVRGDSLAIDTPAERLKELRSFGGAWVGFRSDTTKGEQDWLAGESVVASFADAQTRTGTKAVLRRLEAKQSAQSLYRIVKAGAVGGKPSINYAKADLIVLTLQGSDSIKVEKIDMLGNVDGMQLEPSAVRRDTSRVRTDSLRPRPRPAPRW